MLLTGGGGSGFRRSPGKLWLPVAGLQHRRQHFLFGRPQKTRTQVSFPATQEHSDSKTTATPSTPLLLLLFFFYLKWRQLFPGAGKCTSDVWKQRSRPDSWNSSGYLLHPSAGAILRLSASTHLKGPHTGVNRYIYLNNRIDIDVILHCAKFTCITGKIPRKTPPNIFLLSIM